LVFTSGSVKLHPAQSNCNGTAEVPVAGISAFFIIFAFKNLLVFSAGATTVQAETFC